MLTLSEAKDVATIGAAVVTLLALVKAVFEYAHQGAQKRSEQFVAMRKRFKENETFREVCALVETDAPELKAMAFKDKRDFLGFFEEVALMTNSGLIRPRVAHYMFGYYVLRCWESQSFWSGVNRESMYWALFKDFAERMSAAERTFRFRRRALRF